MIHRCSQLLPEPRPDRWPRRRRAPAGARADLTGEQRAGDGQRGAAGARRSALRAVFGPGSRAEVAARVGEVPTGARCSAASTGCWSTPDRGAGRRLQDQPPAARDTEDADPAYIRQMAVYAALLRQIFPGREVEAALVWTDGPTLMGLPEALLDQALREVGERLMRPRCPWRTLRRPARSYRADRRFASKDSP